MNEPDPMDEFLKQERVEDFHKDVQHTEAKPQKMRTAADDIIEQIGGEAPARAPIRTCSSCGGVDFTTRRPVTGPAVTRCQGCGVKTYGASGPRTVDSAPAMHGQSAGGPYYRGTKVRDPVDPNSPISRLKGRSYRALKAKDD